MSQEQLKRFLEAFATKDHVPVPRLNAEIGEATAAAYVDVFTLMGILDQAGLEVRASPSWENSLLFIRALLDLTSTGRRALGDFTKSGRAQSWVRTLEAIEERRIAYERAVPIRHQFAAQIVIVGASEDGSRFALMDHDPENWESFRLIGGKTVQAPDAQGLFRPTETSITTIERELGEELSREHRSFFRTQLACTPESTTISKRLGAFTWYRFAVFRATEYTDRALEYMGERRKNLRWLRVSDILWAVENAPHLVATDILSDHSVQEELTHPVAVYRMRQADLDRVAMRRSRMTEVIELERAARE